MLKKENKESNVGRSLFRGAQALCAVFVVLAFVVVDAFAVNVPFSTGTITTGAMEASIVFAVDLDGDGDIDILSASQGDDTIAWYENDGATNPSFTIRTITTNNTRAWSLYAADLDMDGDIDVLSSGWWYENDGAVNPSFTLGTITTISNANVHPVADIDGDGDMDVLITRSEDEILWFENDGAANPSFTLGTITVSEGVILAFPADVDGDGDMDVLSGINNGNGIVWHENDGAVNPSFTQGGTITSSVLNLQSLYAADVDGDGDMDVLSASADDNKIAWFENDGAANPSFTAHTISTSVNGVISVFAADVDGDGDMDVLSASNSDDKITWYENDGAANPSFTARTITTDADGAESVFAADIDGDGDMDVLSASANDNKVAWYKNNTIHRSALFPETGTITTSTDSGTTLFVVDIDGDGDMDILSPDDSKIVWFENDGAADPSFTTGTITSSINAEMVFAADIDGDGDIDVLTASNGVNAIVWHENDGAANPSFTLGTITTGVTDGLILIFITDMDGDGDMDVLSVSDVDNKIAWFENDGAANPSFALGTITTSGGQPKSGYAADIDSDGDMDVLVATNLGILWYENDGAANPSFAAGTITTQSSNFFSIFVVDLDQDGDMDVIASVQQFGGASIRWYENDGAANPSFAAGTITTSVSVNIEMVFAVDVDGDGDIDVLSADGGTPSRIVWYENDGAANPSFTAGTITTSVDGATSVYAADLDGDGDMDVLSVSQNDTKIAWYENKGGQFSLATTDTGTSTLFEGTADDMLKIVATHKGKSGETDIELATIELLLEEGAGDPLTTAEANALIENLFVYLDTGSGVFEIGTDISVGTVSTFALTNGSQTVTLVDGDTNVQVTQGTPKTYFVVAELTSDASFQTPDKFRITHITESSSTAEDRDNDIPLSLEFAANGTSTIMQAKFGTPTVNFISSTFSITEGDSGSSIASITVDLNGTSTSTITVNYATSNGTAVSGTDYTSTTGTVTFSAGDSAGTFTVSVTGDTTFESDETITLTLSNAVNATLGTPTATLTITNDDSAPTTTTLGGGGGGSVVTTTTTTTTTTTLPDATPTPTVTPTPEPLPQELSVEFSANPVSGFAPLVVQFTAGQFTNLTEDNPTSFSWQFGDDQSSSEESPLHTYEEPGIYSVTLLVSNEEGSGIKIMPGMINVKAGVPPTAAFGAAPLTGFAPIRVEFTDASTGNINEWRWEFGDGKTSKKQSPDHKYKEPGLFDVKLTVTGEEGTGVEEKTGLINVEEGEGLTASFFGAPLSGNLPFTVHFFDRSSTGNANIGNARIGNASGDVTGWAWEFGDNGTSSDQNPVYTYGTSGVYNVKLTINDENNETSDMTRAGYVEVKDGVGPTVGFTADIIGTPASSGKLAARQLTAERFTDAATDPTGEISGNLTVKFRDISSSPTGDIIGREWDFGDETKSSVKDPEHTYGGTMDDTFAVTLTIQDSQGIDTGTKQSFVSLEEASVEITPTPTAEPTVTPTPAPDELFSLNVVPGEFRRSFLPRIATVTALDENGNPVEGVIIKASASGERAGVRPKERKTGNDGTARFRFRFGLVTKDGKITFTAGKLSATITQGR
ncbi:MAG: FG-GAP-like repeat-containing protein [Candidatus Anammoxibacter sp.]